MSAVPITPDAVPEEIAQADLESIRATYERGLYLDAWRQMEPAGPPEQFGTIDALILAGRIIGNLGDERRARALHSRAWRKDRRNPEAAYFRALAILSRLGPLRALRFMEQLPPFPEASPDVQASLLARRATLLATFRDFSSADNLHAEAAALDAGNAWIWVERAFCLERADRYAEALEAAQHALGLRPFYRPAVQSAAHQLGLLGRDDEALALLEEAARRLQSPCLLLQLASLLGEHHRHAEALETWRRYRELAVLITQPGLEWWHARMSDTHYELGELAAAAEHAKLAKDGFHEKIANRLESPPAEARIVKLQVPFVRQHEMTCAPATLSALSRYWGAPVDHLALAREICYDGTQSHKEYDWAQRNGYAVRFFTVTWEAARALLDRGIPFTLATVETTSAHLQAVVGYDAVRGTIFLRDPFLKHHSECLCPGWLDDYAFCGPRGMVLVPQTETAKLAELDLPDATLWEHLHTVERSLHLHDRPRAAEALAALESAAPNHRITLNARRELAWYDGNQPQALAAIEALLELFPECNNLRWARYHGLRDLARKADHRAALEELARGSKAEPLFWRELGEDMRSDARVLPEARRWVMRALRSQPCTAENLHVMASLLWDERRFADALALYRLAAQLRDKVPYLQRSWFIAARYFHRAEEVLAAFTQRFESDGALSPQPAIILHEALQWLDRTPEAFAVLEKALALRPDDGELLTFTADVDARYGRHEPAAALLERARGRCARGDWLRGAAKLADYRCDLSESLRLWREVLADAPLALDAIRTAVRLTAEVEGRAAALAFLAGKVAQFPHHIPLRQLEIEWLRDDGPAAQEAALRELLELAPMNTWALREAAWGLSNLRRHGEAVARAEEAVALEPQDAGNHYARGHALFQAGRTVEAAPAFRDAIARSVDNAGAIEGLLATCGTFAERRAALDFVLGELRRQVVFGEGLFSYVSVAFPILEPAELLENLRAAHTARPDLWQAWSVFINQLCDARKPAEALSLAREAVDRFPLVPGAWLDLARVHFEQCDFNAEVESLRQACEVSPSWSKAARALAEALQRCERYDEVTAVLENAVASAPLDPINRGFLADHLWRRERHPKVFTLLEEAIRLDPAYAWAWDCLREWSDTPERAVTLARELTRTRGGEPASWVRLARMLPDDQLDERLAALDQALALEPRFIHAHETRSVLLTAAGRYDEAIAACSPPAYGGVIPRSLRAQAAWVTAQRGNVVGALAAMRAVVADESDFYWAWERIAEWSDRLGDQKGARDAAEKMSRLNPRNAVPLGYLADAEMKLGNRQAAIAILERAFALDPSYAFAAFTVFNAHLDSGALDKAEAVLAQLRTHLPGPETVAASIALLARRWAREKALAEFATLVLVPERDSHAIERAGRAIREAGWRADFEALIEQHLDSAGANPALGDEWVRSFTEAGRWKKQTRLVQLDPGSPLARCAWYRFICECGSSKRVRHLRRFIRKRRAALRTDARLWGITGYALSNCDRHREAAEWLGDWRTREGLDSWMLSNVVVSAHELGRFQEALEASTRALTLRHDYTFTHHLLWLACSAVAAGDFAAARWQTNGIRYEDLEDFDKTLWALANAGCAVAEASPANRKAEYRKQLGTLKSSGHAPLLSRNKYLRHITPVIVTRMARDTGLTFPRLRAWVFIAIHFR